MELTDPWPMVLARLRQYLVQSNWELEALTTLASGIGVQPGTIGDWLVEKQPCKGERLIRLWHYLAAVGFDSPELNQLSEHQRYAGSLLGLSIVTMDDLAGFFGVKNSQTVLQILRGQPPQSPVVSLEELQAQYEEALQAKLAKLPKYSTVEELTQPAEVQSAPVKADAQPAALSEYSTIRLDLLDAASKIVSILPLCRYLVSDQVSPEVRSELRDLVGSDELFALSNATDALCGERARNTRG